MPSFGSGYRPDMTPPEKKPTLEEINAELLAALSLLLAQTLSNQAPSGQQAVAKARAAIARATAAQSD